MVCGWRTKVIHFPCLVQGSHRDIILVYSSNWFAHVMWNFGFSLEVVLEWIHFLTVTTTWYQLQIEMLAVLVTSLSHCGGKYMNSLWIVPNMGIHTLAGHVFRRKKVWKVWELHCMSCFFFGINISRPSCRPNGRRVNVPWKTPCLISSLPKSSSHTPKDLQKGGVKVGPFTPILTRYDWKTFGSYPSGIFAGECLVKVVKCINVILSVSMILAEHYWDALPVLNGY